MARQTSGDTETAKPELEDLADQIDTLKADLAELTASIGRFGAAKRDEFAESAKARGRAGFAAVDEAAHELHRSADDFMRTQPATTLGIAAGIGFLVGLLLAKR